MKKIINISKLSPEALEFLRSKGVVLETKRRPSHPAPHISTQRRVEMVEEMQASGEYIEDYHLEHMEDRRVDELYLEWKE